MATFDDLAKALQDAVDKKLNPHSNPEHPLLSTIAAVPEMSKLLNKTHMASTHYHRWYDVNMACIQLMARANQTSVAHAIEELRAFIDKPQAKITFAYVLGGVKCKSRVTVSEDIRIIPWGPKEEECGQTLGFYWDVVSNLHKQFVQQGLVCAIVMNKTMDIAFRNDRKFDTKAPWPSPEMQVLEDVLSCLTLAGPCAPVVLESFGETFGQHAAVTFIGAGNSSDGTRHNLEGTQDHLEKVPGLYRHWLKLPTDQQQVLRISIGRLRASVRRRSMEDRAIDLGIAMDALFAPEQSSEISYRLRIRSSKFLGSNLEERKEIAKAMNAVYGERSKAVHYGLIAKNHDDIMRVSAVLQRGTDLLVAALLKVVTNEQIPNWDDLLLQ